MKKSRLILIMMVLLSWSSLLFLGRRDFQKYLPATLFTVLVTKITHKIAKKESGGVLTKVFILKLVKKTHGLGDCFSLLRFGY